MVDASESRSRRAKSSQGGNVNPPRNRKSESGNPPPTARPTSSAPISTKLQWIATLAKRDPKMSFTSLAHHIDIAWLKEAYRRTRKDAAVGIDGQTADEYAQDLDENLRSLLERVKSGRYRAPSVLRVHIPKGSGSETRPIGMPTFEDKVLQRAVVMVMEAIYEQDFEECSYGFRPARSAHQALEAFWQQAMDIRGGWVLEVDIEKFFDSMDHDKLREILQHRVQDGVILRLIGKWLKAGVCENGGVSYPEQGTPQGGVISPLLANVYLHEVVDVWFEQAVKPRLSQQAFLVRYADDMILGFASQEDAERVQAALARRFAQYGLRLHPKKTRLLHFRRPLWGSKGKGNNDWQRPETFDFLGFTHMWARSQHGYWSIRRQTAKSRFTRSLHAVAQWCRRHRHSPVRKQHQQLSAKLRGHYGYYGITGNGPRLSDFRRAVERAWRKWLDRRCHHAHMTWERYLRLLQRYPLPEPRVVQSVFRNAAKP